MTFEPKKYIQPLLDLFRTKGIPEDAVYMKKYLKNQFEFFGLKKDARQACEKQFFEVSGLPGYENLDKVCHSLWEQPQRECQHTAIVLSNKYAKQADDDFLTLIEYMITQKSWWDTVDFVAAHHSGTYLSQRTERIKEITGKWMQSGHMWLQRSALLFQLKYKTQTDFELMKSYILSLSSSKEFFIKKAIGWVLREYSKTDQEKVRSFVEVAPISSFSKKEALKWLNRQSLST